MVGNDSGSCVVAGFVINSVEPLGSFNMVSYTILILT